MDAPLDRTVRTPGLVALCLLTVLASLALVPPAEARGPGRTVVGGWSTGGIVLVAGEARQLRLVLRGAVRAGRTVSLQAAGQDGSWTTVDRTTSARRGAVVLDVPAAAPFRGSVRVVVDPVRRARGVVTAPRALHVRSGEPAPGPVPSPTPDPTTTPDPEPSPVPVPPAPPAPPAPGTMTAAEAEVLRLVNEARSVSRPCGDTTYAAAGPLRAEPRLTLASRAHALDMGQQGYFAHTSADGRSPWDRARAAGYQTASGENIAAGFGTPTAVVRGWLDSPGHCRNLMAAGARDLGVGLAEVPGSPYRSYWVQMFGRG